MPYQMLRDRSLAEEGLNAFWCLVSFGLIDREVRLAERALEDEERQ